MMMKDRKFRTSFSKRQYMISEDYELYYYNDTELRTVDFHCHDYYEFYFFIEGNVSMTIERKTYPLAPYDVIAIPPKTSHRVEIHDDTTPYKRVVLWVSERFFKDLLDRSDDFGFVIGEALESESYIHSLDIVSFNRLRYKIFSIIQEQLRPGFGSQSQILILINDLLLNLNRSVYESINKPEIYAEHTLYEKILAYIDLHIDEKITLDDIASTFFISKYHASHLFSYEAGIPLHQYINKKRLSLCRTAIKKGVPPTKVSAQYGFKDYSVFYKAYKKEYGHPPSEGR